MASTPIRLMFWSVTLRRPEVEIEAFFPREVVDAKGYAGMLFVYPRRRVISRLENPEETE
jgi:hypothetical protein